MDREQREATSSKEVSTAADSEEPLMNRCHEMLDLTSSTDSTQLEAVAEASSSVAPVCLPQATSVSRFTSTRVTDDSASAVTTSHQPQSTSTYAGRFTSTRVTEADMAQSLQSCVVDGTSTNTMPILKRKSYAAFSKSPTTSSDLSTLSERLKLIPKWQDPVSSTQDLQLDEIPRVSRSPLAQHYSDDDDDDSFITARETRSRSKTPLMVCVPEKDSENRLRRPAMEKPEETANPSEQSDDTITLERRVRNLLLTSLAFYIVVVVACAAILWIILAILTSIGIIKDPDSTPITTTTTTTTTSTPFP